MHVRSRVRTLFTTLAAPIRIGADRARDKAAIERSRMEQSALDADRLANRPFPFALITLPFATVGCTVGAALTASSSVAVQTASGIGGGMVGLILLAVLIRAGYWVHAPASLLKEVRSSLPRPGESATADAMTALADEGDELRRRIEANDRSLGDAALAVTAEWDQRAVALITAKATRYLRVYQAWQLPDDPIPPAGPGGLPTPDSERQRALWQLRKWVPAMRDIALRLRVEAGEDVPPLTAKRARLKDIFLDALHRGQELRGGAATEEAVRRWDTDLRRLVDAAFQAADREWFLHWADDFEPSQFSFVGTELPQDAVAILAIRDSQLVELQMRLDSMDLRGDFDPRDWESLWA